MYQIIIVAEALIIIFLIVVIFSNQENKYEITKELCELKIEYYTKQYEIGMYEITTSNRRSSLDELYKWKLKLLNLETKSSKVIS